MKLQNWLERKFPLIHDKLTKAYPEYQLQYLKTHKYNVGILKEDNGLNKKGDLVIYKRHKEILEENENGYEYPSPGGWTGGFEYYYHFAKHSNLHGNRCYTKLVEDFK